jgi:hypothetical protein
LLKQNRRWIVVLAKVADDCPTAVCRTHGYEVVKQKSPATFAGNNITDFLGNVKHEFGIEQMYASSAETCTKYW